MYTPGFISDNPAELAQSIRRELTLIAQVLSQPVKSIVVDTIYSEPSRILEGMIVKADGTLWNPGSGAGPYMYFNSTWHFLG